MRLQLGNQTHCGVHNGCNPSYLGTPLHFHYGSIGHSLNRAPRGQQTLFNVKPRAIAKVLNKEFSSFRGNIRNGPINLRDLIYL